MSSGEINNIYLLITTEFKRTAQKLGKLEDYSKKVAEYLNDINNELLKKIDDIKVYRLPRSMCNYTDSIRDLNSKKIMLETCIINLLDDFFELDKDTISEKIINYYLEKYDQKILFDQMGLKKYRSLLIYYKDYINVSIEKSETVKLIQIDKDEDKERRKIIENKMEENYIIKNGNLFNQYEHKLIKGGEFQAVILNHHFLSIPYLHLLYTVLKYDIVKKLVYVDIFVSVVQYIKDKEIRQKEFIPKMFDETMSGSDFADKYAVKIYEIMKSDLSNYKLLMGRLLILNNNIFSETGNKIEYNSHNIHLKLQKNFAQYLSGKIPIDDNQTKVKLCNIKSENSIPADDKYNYVVNKSWELISEKGLLNNKSYTVIATSIELLKQNIIIEKNGEEDGHAESQLMKKYCNNLQFMNGFRSCSDIIYVMRFYQRRTIGCGLCCSRCVSVLTGNGIHRVVYSMDHNYFQYCDMNNNTYTYTTTGNKLLNTDTYLYDDHILEFK